MNDYTIKDTEREFYQYLLEEVEEFEAAIEYYNDTSLLKQDTCDVIRIIKNNNK